MTTNGRHSTETPAAATEPVSAPPSATSNVLPLDGWGPVPAPSTPEPNGVNGADGVDSIDVANGVEDVDAPQPPAESPPVAEQPRHRAEAGGHTLRGRATLAAAGFSLDSALMRLLAPAVVMGAAIWITLKLSSEFGSREWRSPFQPEAAATRSVRSERSEQRRIDTLRRRAALAIDPTLTPKPQPQPWWRTLLD